MNNPIPFTDYQLAKILELIRTGEEAGHGPDMEDVREMIIEARPNLRKDLNA